MDPVLEPSSVVTTIVSNAITAVIAGYVGLRKSRSDRTKILFEQHDKLAARIEQEAENWKEEADKWRKMFLDTATDKLALSSEIADLKNQLNTEVADCKRDKIELESRLLRLRSENKLRETELNGRIADLETKLETYLRGRVEIRERVTALETAVEQQHPSRIVSSSVHDHPDEVEIKTGIINEEHFDDEVSSDD